MSDLQNKDNNWICKYLVLANMSRHVFEGFILMIMIGFSRILSSSEILSSDGTFILNCLNLSDNMIIRSNKGSAEQTHSDFFQMGPRIWNKFGSLCQLLDPGVGFHSSFYNWRWWLLWDWAEDSSCLEQKRGPKHPLHHNCYWD